MPKKPAPAREKAPEPALPATPDLEPLLRELTGRVLDALNRNTAAILAAGIMSSRGRAHTPEEAIRLHQEMIATLWPRVPGPPPGTPKPAEQEAA
ncbi:MAG TPA: hypothetical protein VMA86_09190 [Acetobacteraceae bacterium]|nr:hypothetical protein [Acetobacteraceae bacterium]